MTETPKKKLFGQPKSQVGRLAKALSISFYPQHMDVLARREREFNVHRSILVQLLLEIEAREDLLRRELVSRIRKGAKSRQES
jgi:hypothetical protein